MNGAIVVGNRSGEGKRVLKIAIEINLELTACVHTREVMPLIIEDTCERADAVEIGCTSTSAIEESCGTVRISLHSPASAIRKPVRLIYNQGLRVRLLGAGFDPGINAKWPVRVKTGVMWYLDEII